MVRNPMKTAARGTGVLLATLVLLLPALSWASPAPEKPAGSVSGEAGRAAVIRALGSNEPRDFLAAMDADRLLLFEVRKDLPDTRGAAETYLKHLKELAAQSDPARLVPKVNRMIEQAPIYYDWVEKNIKDQGDNANEYVVGGARGFLVAFQDFQSELMLIVINRLEIAGNAIRGAAALSPG